MVSITGAVGNYKQLILGQVTLEGYFADINACFNFLQLSRLSAMATIYLSFYSMI